MKKNHKYICENVNKRGRRLIKFFQELCGLLFPCRHESGGWIPEPYSDTISPQPVSFTMSWKNEVEMKGNGGGGGGTDRITGIKYTKMYKMREKRGKRHNSRTTFPFRILTEKKVKVKVELNEGIYWNISKEGQYEACWQCDGKLVEASVSQGCY